MLKMNHPTETRLLESMLWMVVVSEIYPCVVDVTVQRHACAHTTHTHTHYISGFASNVIIKKLS